MTLPIAALSLAQLGHDVVVLLGLAAALLAGVVLVNLGLLLPGLLGWLDGHHGDPSGGVIEPGPGNPSIITEPARRRPTAIADAAAVPTAAYG